MRHFHKEKRGTSFILTSLVLTISKKPTCPSHNDFFFYHKEQRIMGSLRNLLYNVYFISETNCAYCDALEMPQETSLHKNMFMYNFTETDWLLFCVVAFTQRQFIAFYYSENTSNLKTLSTSVTRKGTV